MTYDQFETAFSAPRLHKYKIACNNDLTKSLKLYRANIRISQKLFAVIGIFEIVLRNSINRHFVATKGTEWLVESLDEPDGYFNNPGCEDSYHSVQQAIYKLGLMYTHDALVASLTFGFWAYQFSKNEFPASGSTLLSIFVNRPKGTKQRDIFQKLTKINILRNRVAHHEPICFNGVTGQISTEMIIKRYALICDLLQWLGYNSSKLFFGVDGVKKEIAFLNSIIASALPHDSQPTTSHNNI